MGGIVFAWGVIDSIAVLPFVNTSSDPDTEYLSDGITESLINALSQLRNVRVTARSTVFRYKGTEVDPRNIGRALGVRAGIVGAVVAARRHADRPYGTHRCV